MKALNKLGKALPVVSFHPWTILLSLNLQALSHTYTPRKVDKEFEELLFVIIRRISPISADISGTGAIIFTNKRATFYLRFSRLSERSLKKSYYAWRSISKTKMNVLVPLFWERNIIASESLWCVETLTKKDSVTYLHALKILHMLWTLGQISSPPYTKIQKWEVTVCFLLNHLKSQLHQKWYKRIEELKEIQWRIGPAHRDFTSKNILFRNETPVIIDLDRFTWKGFQIFDLAHFCVELHCKKNRVSWFSVVNLNFFERMLHTWKNRHYFNRAITIHPDYLSSDLLDLYILERLSLEVREGITPPTSWLEEGQNLLSTRSEGFHFPTFD